MSQHVISIREIIAITLTMAKRTDFVDRPAPVDGLSTKGCDPETISFSHGKRYRNLISRMLINVGNRILISQGNFKFCKVG